MFRRLALHLRTLAPAQSVSKTTRFAVGSSRAPENAIRSFPILSRHFSTESGNVTKRVEDVMPIATGHEREELEAELQGRDILEIDHPAGPFGTKWDYKVRPVGSHSAHPSREGWRNQKVDHGPWNRFFDFVKSTQIQQEEPAVVKSYYDKRIVGCPGGEGEDEHDVVWFWLEKGKPHECPVCSQYFVLEVVGPGGSPDGHGDDEDDHH